ncbi:hypothetical protein [Alkalihalobacillus pseudalcaliphilus]|uniref:hypothetical protein n=1 Tax=Alkalihalobacillus pseudalcaliphilus TaxID=79884 RepID=UPI00064DE2AB|nr:hypothetical protein [Alkalihalobacillus pseudalcaliphilus]KMK78150.1 hypothetical protein AB990_01550 [Alkalihalobacillus pseudalcaliphilus]
MKRYSNGVAKFLFIIGLFITIIGFCTVSLFVYLEFSDSNHYNYYGSENERFRMIIQTVFYSYNSFGFSGIFMIAAAELIQVLHNHHKKLEETPTVVYQKQEEEEKQEEVVRLKASEQYKVHHFFEQLGLDVEEIIVPPFEGYIIALINEEAHLVELGEFQPKLLKFENYPEILDWFTNQSRS